MGDLHERPVVIMTITLVYPDGSTTATHYGVYDDDVRRQIEALAGPAVYELYFDPEAQKAASEAMDKVGAVVMLREAP